MKKDYPMIHQKPSVKLLRDIVNTVTGVDVRNSKGRQRHLVNAKMIYSKILMDKGFGCSQVGKSIRKHHTTILNYQNKWDGYVFSDDSLKGDYKIEKLHSGHWLIQESFEDVSNSILHHLNTHPQ